MIPELHRVREPSLLDLEAFFFLLVGDAPPPLDSNRVPGVVEGKVSGNVRRFPSMKPGRF